MSLLRTWAGLAVFLPTASLAAPLPITGTYCGDGIKVSSKGVGFADWSCIAADTASAPRYTIVCEGDDPDGLQFAATIEENSDGTLSYTDEDGEPMVLPRCD